VLLSMLWVTMGQSGRLQFRFPMETFEFLIDITLPAALSLRGRLSRYQKWVPGIFTKDKGGRCVGLTTLPPSCTDCHEIWEPESSGTLRAFPEPYRHCFTPISVGYHSPASMLKVIFLNRQTSWVITLITRWLADGSAKSTNCQTS